MKQTFSAQWNASTQPRKQRKFRFNAPLHVRGKFLGCHLSKDLRQKHKTRSLRIRVGDGVKVLRGQYSGKTGKVERIDAARTHVFVAGIDQPKRDGTKKLYPLQPSNIMITKLTDDKRRLPVAPKARTANAPHVPTGKASGASAAKQTKSTPKSQNKPAAKTAKK